MKAGSAATGSFRGLIRSLHYAPFPAFINDAKFNHQGSNNLSTVCYVHMVWTRAVCGRMEMYQKLTAPPTMIPEEETKKKRKRRNKM